MAGFEPRVSFESDDYETVQGLVAAGVGVALIPRLALARVHAGVIVRSLTPSSPSRSVVVATPPEPSVSPAARAMLQILIDLAEGGDHGAKPRRPAPAPPRPRNIRAQ
jgi:DNA-binding transcriptional LysR family regulator